MMVFESVTAAVISAADLILSPITIFPPYIGLAILSVILTLLVVGLGRILTNRKMVAEIRMRTEDLRARLAQAQKDGNKDMTKQLLNDLMKTNSEYMRHSFKMLIVSLVVISLFLPWASYTYEGKTIAALPFSAPFIGSNLSWIYWYVLISFSVGWLIRKLFGLE